MRCGGGLYVIYSRYCARRVNLFSQDRESYLLGNPKFNPILLPILSLPKTKPKTKRDDPRHKALVLLSAASASVNLSRPEIEDRDSTHLISNPGVASPRPSSSRWVEIKIEKRKGNPRRKDIPVRDLLHPLSPPLLLQLQLQRLLRLYPRA